MMLQRYFLGWLLPFSLALACWLGLGVVPALAQTTKIRGFVHDEHRNPVANASILFDGTPLATSDAEGKFEVELPAGTQPMRINVEKAGDAFSQTIWGYVEHENGDAETIKIKVVRPGNFIGRITNERGVAVARAMVRIAGDVAFGPVSTDEDGDFFMKIPQGKRVSSNVSFYVGGQLVPPSQCDLNVAGQTVNIIFQKQDNSVIQIAPRPGQTTKPTEDLVYTIRLVDATGRKVPNTPILINNTQYRSDSSGRMLFRGQVPPGDQFEPAQGFRRIKVEQDDTRNEVTVVLEKEVSAADLELPIDKNSYNSQLEAIAMGLEKEQLALNARGMELRREIARLAMKLSQEKNLPAEQKEEIGESLARLKHTLEENDREYRLSQERTRELIDKVRHDLDLVAEQNREMEEKAKQQLVFFLLVTASLTGLVLLFYFISDKMRRQRNELNATRHMLEEKIEEVRVKNEKILAQTDKLKALNHTISTKNRKITDSIGYAQSMQAAILPSPMVLRQHLKDHFIIYQSKEIVSGDLYWCSRVQASEGSRLTLAAIDCTGHGVPGGFMSMIAHTLLSEIINHKGVSEPKDILQELNGGIHAALNQDERLLRDGMDLAICSLEEAGNGQVRVLFSGARRPLIYVEPGKEATYVKGETRSIGGIHAAHTDSHFTHQEFLLPSGTALYLTSDGFAEQGTAKTGKIGTKQLLEVLAAHGSEPMSAQQAALEQLLERYQVHTEQRDDILVFGIRL
jgi:serine phosphatase RsbU (regulator of sigma subunit)